MQEVGRVAHLAASGRVIIRASGRLEEGQVLHDGSGRRVARVVEMIGPVRRPFASAMPLTNNIARHEGRAVFAAPGGRRG